MLKYKTIKISATIFILLLLTLTIIFSIGVYNDSTALNFGSTNDPMSQKRLKKDCCRALNMEGLTDLNAYGSGAIHYPSFKEHISEKIKTGEIKKLYVVNLINDELYYYNDRCLRWYGIGCRGKTLGKHIFSRKPYKAIHTGLIRLIYGTPPTHDLSQLQTERQIVHKMGANYYVPLKEKPNWLGNQDFMDDLIHFFESLPKDALLYFHCVHGKGRTTTFLVFYDIFLNSKKVPLKDIANRHYCLGREDVLDTNLWSKGTWTQSALDARKAIVERFYDYMTDPKGYGHQPWVQWSKAKGIEATEIAIHR